MDKQHIRILNLEDSAIDADLIVRELKRANLDFSATRVETEQSFRAALESSDPDVILADYNLPGFDGIAALKIAQSLVPDIPFIFVSGSIGEERAVQALREGATDYVIKDRLSRLPSAISRALAEKQERLLRTRTQEALRTSEERFRYAVLATAEVIWDWDLATNKFSFNEALRTVWGYEMLRGDVDIQWWEERVHPEDRADILQSLTDAIESDELWAAEYRFQRADGRYGSVLDRALIIRDDSGQNKRMIGAMLDITEQVVSEQMIRRLSHQNKMILKHAAEGILGFDADGRVIFANPAAAAFTGWSIEELRAAPRFHDLVHHSRANGEPYPMEECPLLLCLADGKPRSAEDNFWRKSGESFPVHFSCSPIIEESRITGSVTVFEDITERKRLKNQLEQANRVSTLGRVAATIAHEFNNVLMGIQPFAEVIRRNTDDEKILKAAAQIASSVTRGKRVTEEILRFTQPAEPALQAVSLGEWLQRLLPELESLVGADIEIIMHVPSDAIIVRGDPAQLQQVLTNLVLNARDAMSGKGVITMSVQHGSGGQEFGFGPIPAGMAVISVRDIGSGMAPAVLQNIFEPLFTTKRTGTGLGLAVAQQVIRRHGGSIHAESKKGEGTTFFILLPKASAETPAVAAEKQQATVRARRAVLVEDEPAVATGIVMLLEVEGIDVRLVEYGGQALEAIEVFQPDVVILDMSLPDMRGTDVFQRIAAHHPTLPVLFSSGDSDVALLERYISSEHVGFLRKPYDFAALMEALDTITRKVGPE